MTNSKRSQLTVTRRDIPSARRAGVLRPEDRPSGVRPTAPLAAAEEEVVREDEAENASTKAE
jgi:hypothetical protein